MEIKLPDGTVRRIIAGRFHALDSWRVRSEFVRFAYTEDPAFKKKFVLEVLSYATAVNGETEMPLTTAALIDNHVQTPANIAAVLEFVLELNGIDPKTTELKNDYYANAAEEMATSFYAEIKMAYGPLIQSTINKLEK